MTGDRANRGMTIIELVVILAIVTILIAVATTYLIRARASGNEASAVASLRTVVSGQLAYSVSCGRGHFAPSLLVLAQPAPGSITPFLPPDLLGGSTVLKAGYYVTVRPSATSGPGPADCHGLLTRSSYYASARPATLGSGGSRSFAVTPQGQIWQVDGGVPPAEPFGPPATPVR